MLLSAAPGLSTSPAMNVSEEDAKTFYSTTVGPWNICLSGFYILIFIVAVPGNILALWAFCKEKSTSPSKIFLRNLAIADICYVLVLPMRIVYHLSDGHWPFGHILCQLSGFLFYLNMYCSLYIMSFISLDRVLAVVLPVSSQSVRKPLFANISVVLLWVIVLVSMIPTLFSTKNQMNSTSTCSKLYLEKTSPKALVSTIVAFVIPLTTIVISYVLILLKLRTLKKDELRRVKNKAAKMIILILINFLLAFMPYHVCRVIYIKSISPGLGSMSEALVKANQITSALTCISGILDPVMYFYLNRVYKNTFLQLFCKNREQDKSSGSKSGQRANEGI